MDVEACEQMDQKRALRQLLEVEKLGKEMRLAAEQWASEWQTLIAILLSARTRDEVTIEVCKELFMLYPGARGLAHARSADVKKVIHSVNFYRNKARNIIACSQALVKQYEGKVPHDIGALIALPGVGRKTANVFLSENEHDAIGVDTHVSYISQKLRWARSGKPEKIEEELKALFPQKEWSRINGALVRFGKTHLSRKKKDALLAEIAKMR